MGEMADAVLDGVFCQGCGEYMGEGAGYPVFCVGCGPATEEDIPTLNICPICKKRLKSDMGVRQHLRDKHGE